MRSLASGFVAKILMGLLVLSFAVWGIADIFSNFGRGAIATVGDTEIDARDYQSQLVLEVNALSNQLGRRLTPAQTSAFGLPTQVLGRMISEATLNDMAKDFNMGLSSEELAKVIATEPAFQFSGRFDRNQMNLMLRNAGTTEDRYVLSREALETRKQLSESLTGKTTVPNAALKVFNTFTYEQRDIDYIALQEDDLGEIEEPTDEALQTYFDANKIQFRAPEYRSFVVLKLEPGDIMDASAVTDEDAKIYYETASSRFVQPEKRQMQQILFGTREEAEAASEKIKNGASFDDIVNERNLSMEDVNFGLLTKEQITDPAAAEAIYSLDEGAVSDVIEGRFGFLILRNAKIEPQQASPFDEIKDQLKAEIAAERASGEVLGIFDKVEDERAGGATLKEVSDKFNLPLREVSAISKTGELETGEKITDLPEQETLLSSVFDNEIDYEADPIDIGSTGFAWFNVTDIIPDRDRTLDEVRDDVVSAWKAEERRTRNAAKAEEILAEIKAGKSLDAVASDRDLTKQTATDITRRGGADLPTPVVEKAFEGPRDSKTTAVNGTTQYVLQVVDVTEPDFSPDALQLENVRSTLNRNFGTDLLGQLSSAKLRELEYTINEPLLQQIVNGSN
ncbi:SurA N-terminal domain-containing protein [Cohaesibacter sp. ES.047]|uniref:SurA N-terminal domain-containing protein n=1 Tax=Cohaesibacter sp. ES.047 TaxID=1798205 RepID=UPI00156036F5|nr:SurA N-terminal domain-containing protein [Cohaesibacter sp. ES.047]